MTINDINVGGIYLVKPEFRNMCCNFQSNGATYIKITEIEDENHLYYVILDNRQEKIASCCYCLKPEHLLPFEKTLETLEIGDIIIDCYQNYRKVLAVLAPSVYVLSASSETTVDDSLQRVYGTLTAFELSEYGYTIYTPPTEEPIEELTVEEVSKRLGKTIKIVK